MAGSKHQNWLFIVDGKQRIFRKLNDGFDVLEYERYTYTEEHTEAVCNLIRDNLTENLLGADFIKKYPKTHKRWNDPYFGYCVPATFALLYLMDTDKLEPITSKDKEGIDHWWLRDKDHPNKIYDITHEQYADKTVLKQHPL